MDSTERRIKAQLYRIACPSSDELGEYHLDMLTGEQVAHIEHHLHGCPHCRRELEQLQEYLAALAPDLEYSFKERVQILIARLLPDMDGMGTFPQAAMALRGGDTGPLMYEAGPARLSLEIKEDPERPGHKSLLGLLIGIEPAGVQAAIWRQGTALATSDLDDLGNFVMTGLEPGDYELILAGPETEIHVQSLSL